MKKKYTQRIGAGVMAFMLAAGLCGCGAANSTADSISIVSSSAAQNGYYNMADTAAYDYDSAAGESYYEEAVSVSGTTTAGAADTYQQSGQKLIRTENITAETTDFDNAVNAIKARVGELSGYIESSSTYGTGKGYNLRSVNMCVRIPEESLDLFMQTVGSSTLILSSSESTKDVTLDYVDMESHVKALRAEQEALMSLLEQAVSLDDIIRIQSQLTQVRYEIESYESSLRTMDNLVSYSTVNLTLSEVERETIIVEKKSFGQEVTAGLQSNLYSIIQWVRSAALWLIISLPYIAIWAVVILAVVLIGRKLVKKLRKKHAAEKSND
jgi:hypothetical protein